MSGISNLLAPYSHLLFGNRDKVIVVLALVLGWTVVQLLVARWRTERLERDLSTARSGQSTSPARVRHTAASAQADEAPAESGALPPIKGGRSYARNLGSALQKAGIPAAAGPQLYSPPVPAGWNPNTGTAPGAPIQPPMPSPTYAPPPAPWGAPPAQAAPPPWGYPAGANRPPYPAQPGTQTPPPYAPASAPFPFPSPNQGQPAPNLYPPAPAYGQPSFPAMTNAAPQGPPMAEPTAPLAAQPRSEAQPVSPSADSDPTEESRRGKPKRRRFSLSVLDNLEKIVQSKTGDPSPTIVPPVVPLPTTAEAAPVVETPTPATDAESAAVEPSAADEQSTTADAAPEEQVVADLEPGPAVVAESPIERAEPASEPESGRSLRSTMRAMLFGEEPVQAPPARETEAVAEVTEAASTTSPTDEVTAPDAHAESEPSDEAPVEPITADTSAEAEAATPSVAIDDERHDVVAETEPQAQADFMSEPVAVEAEQADPEQAPQATQPPAESEATARSAGTLVIIEDDQAAADYYATLFRGNGYHVDVANDGVSGVDLCTRVQPQVILLDVMMPRQNGILVLQTLRASDETRNTPVVVMSNFSEPTLIKRALQLGALEYVIKTQVAGPALLAAVPHWLNREKAFAA